MRALIPLSWGFRVVCALRHFLYDTGWLGVRKAPVTVVSVGNIAVGGTGKTQVSLLLAQALAPYHRVALLSRGYRSQAGKCLPFVVDCARHGPAYCGDEPWLMAHRLKNVPVWVARNRWLGAVCAAQAGASLVIVDDGMQHRRLGRAHEIVVLDGADPWAGGYFLPAGGLRDLPARLRHADLLVCVGKSTEPQRASVARWSAAPWVEVEIVTQGPFDLAGNLVEEEARPIRVGVFCALGNPERFVRSVEGQGMHVVHTDFLPDHTAPSLQHLARCAHKAKSLGATALLCSEKDKVKLFSLAPLALPVYWLKAELAFVEGKEHWEKFVGHLLIHQEM